MYQFCCADHELAHEHEKARARGDGRLLARFEENERLSREEGICAYCGREGPRPGYNRAHAERSLDN